MRKKLILIYIIICVACAATAQDADRRAGEMINGSRYFELERMMRTPEALQLSPFMRRLASALTAHYFNRPAEACLYIDSLLQDNQAELGTQSSLSMAFLMGRDLASSGKYAEAAKFMNDMAAQIRALAVQNPAADTSLLKSITTEAGIYHAYAAEAPLCRQLHKPGTYSASFYIDERLHGYRRGGFLTVTGSVNGRPTAIAIDTGAGVNIVPPEEAERLGLRYIDAGMKMMGLGVQTGRIAIADTLRIGRNMAWVNVPFVVVDIRTGNSEADRVMERGWPLTIGVPMLNAMKEMQIDCGKRVITVPEKPTPRNADEPNMMMKDSRNMTVRIEDGEGKPLFMLFDTGDYYTSMNSRWYRAHEDEVKATGVVDSLRKAGVGGVEMQHSYILPSISLKVGGATVEMDSVNVETGIDLHTGEMIAAGSSSVGGNEQTEDGCIGLNIINHFGKITINMPDMYLRCEEPGKGYRREWLFE